MVGRDRTPDTKAKLTLVLGVANPICNTSGGGPAYSVDKRYEDNNNTSRQHNTVTNTAYIRRIILTSFLW